MPARKPRHLSMTLIWVLLLLLSACSSPAQPEPAPSETPPAALPSETSTVEPSPTPTPPPGKVVLVSGGSSGYDLAAFSQQLSALAAQAGLIYEERAALQASEIGSDWRVVVFASDDPVVSEALGAHPGVQFLVVSDHELGMAGNLSVIRLRWDYQAFLAGYLSILITPDWRTGGLFPPDDPGSLQAQAFVNGAQYFCGICASKLSPIVRFPVTAWLAGSADPLTRQAEVDALMSNILYVMYVAPGSSNPDLLADLAQRNLVLVGGEPPQEGMQPRWAASVVLDPTAALAEVWPEILAGQGGKAVDAPVLVRDINEDFFSIGRQRLVEETLQELQAGWVYPLDVPVQ